MSPFQVLRNTLDRLVEIDRLYGIGANVDAAEKMKKLIHDVQDSVRTEVSKRTGLSPHRKV